MKKALFAFVFCSVAQAFAGSVLICQSTTKVRGWNASETFDFLRLTAYVASNTEIQRAELKGAYVSDTRDLKADSNYRPRSAAYANFNRFSVLEDAWHWFSPLLPKDLNSQSGRFTGFVQIMGEEGFKETVRLNCHLRN